MPVRLPGRRAVGRGGNLKPWEKARIVEWFIEGKNVVQVYGECLDNGIAPPHNETLYKILNTPEVQEGLRARRAKELKKSIASISRRTASRDDLLGRIERTVQKRAKKYETVDGGGDEGLIVLADQKSVLVAKDADGGATYDKIDIYKTDTGILEQWRGVLTEQERADAALRKNLRGEEREDQEADLREQTGEIRDLEKQKIQAELEKALLELAQLRAEAKRMSEGGGYQPPTFPAVIVEKLENPNRAAVVAEEESAQEEGVDPEIPWMLLQEEETDA